jgi:tetratricopeptide (TPR) repeat protein
MSSSAQDDDALRRQYYGARDIRSLYPRVTENHLRYLEKWGLIREAAHTTTERFYPFTDVSTIRQLATELDRGVPLKNVLRALLAEHQGQMQLDFRASVSAPPAKVVVLPGRPPSRTPNRAGNPFAAGNAFPFSDPQTGLAAKYFIEGSKLDDGDERKMEEAATAYRRALVIDPELVPAIVNLSNIHYAQDALIEAQALYERAIALDPDCFEAHFNLGNIHHDLARYDEALACYRDAVALNPDYADAHFYLAVTLEKTGHSVGAKPHWRRYQELAPDGEWIELAREFSE